MDGVGNALHGDNVIVSAEWLLCVLFQRVEGAPVASSLPLMAAAACGVERRPELAHQPSFGGTCAGRFLGSGSRRRVLSPCTAYIWIRQYLFACAARVYARAA